MLIGALSDDRPRRTHGNQEHPGRHRSRPPANAQVKWVVSATQSQLVRELLFIEAPANATACSTWHGGVAARSRAALHRGNEGIVPMWNAIPGRSSFASCSSLRLHLRCAPPYPGLAPQLIHGLHNLMSRSDTRRYLIAYDITADQRRDQLATRLSRHGDRVQYSIFVIDISPVRLVNLRAEITRIVRTAEDSTLICDLGLVHMLSADQFHRVGRTRPITGNQSIVADP
ncbi:CRISPR-associated endonuclease Cas2 [Nocardia sp. BMG111209]|uniref:CRISPR-associated endonuclease Cas2 n=1 Tax=Nocardia sp. BMG111209 TaxID=1160137 RepID=UPI001E3BD465|nr:CRISPR-associated endonuclease Cas2 [Nocardia sp. BMG111209]